MLRQNRISNATASEPLAIIAVTTLNTPTLAMIKVETSAPTTPPRFSSTPHQAALAGLKPDRAAIKGVQLLRRYAAKSRQKIANEAVTVIQKRRSAKRTMKGHLHSARRGWSVAASEAYNVSGRSSPAGMRSRVTTPVPTNRLRQP
jgi:hypothetical protein